MPTKSAVQPVDDEVQIDHVPRSAQERYWALVAARDASFDKVIGSTERMTELREDKKRADRDLSGLQKANEEGKLFVATRPHDDPSGMTETRSPDLARLGAAQRRAEAAGERFDRARAQHQLLSDETAILGRLVHAAESYFASTRKTRLKVADVTPPALEKGETAIQALDRVREEIADLQRQRRMVSRGPGSVAEVKALMRRAVTDLAREGQPDLAGLFRPERPAVGWPQVIIPGVNVGGYHARVVNAAGLLAAVFEDELVRFLDKKIDAFGAQVEGEQFTENERAKRLADIDQKTLGLEYGEQVLLDRLASEGATILPRPDADIRALLRVEGPPLVSPR